MPIYEYRCESCGHQLEALQKISDEPLTECPQCENGSLRKLVSATAFRLSGSGWYETDFKKSNKRNLASEKSGKSEGGKSDKSAKTQATTPA
jgi:putative FmdB family regulatory protein